MIIVYSISEIFFQYKPLNCAHWTFESFSFTCNTMQQQTTAMRFTIKLNLNPSFIANSDSQLWNPDRGVAMGCGIGFHKINLPTKLKTEIMHIDLESEIWSGTILYNLMLQRNPELKSTYSQWLYWANFCSTPTQINEIPKPLVRTVKRDSTWSRPQNTFSQAVLKKNACCFSGKCPSPGLKHDQSLAPNAPTLSFTPLCLL